ncbi:protein kinase domain-containing protein [Lachnoanaerobaculum saburreum]|uniref:non-specific serine/threonine protein kinase n=1 Tax=Lachnoanaerobaculum saburreum TaxID=467210 RepID=A0A133ZHW7_9FIRM|nr:serine/threonine-protein kinase [Lachnoanaerobaculum saburreum]KXB55039.1 kinase domain protein [Lachnoanaerobaculum saburreum]
MELIGKVLAKRYTIVEKLGHGGYGDVYRAFDANLQLDVVVKKLKDLRKSENGGREEVDVLKQLHQENLPAVFDFFVEDGQAYTVMSLIPGQDLEEVREKYPRFNQKQVLYWAKQLARALAYLHTRKPSIIHSDIKPSNIMLKPDGDVCLIDFNISLAITGDYSYASGTSKGFSPPEQYPDLGFYLEKTGAQLYNTEYDDRTSQAVTIMRKTIGSGIDERSDIYSLGATLYTLITGEKPSSHYWNNGSILDKNISISPGFAHIIDKMMQLDPDDRYQNGVELLDALDNIIELDDRFIELKRKRRGHRAITFLMFATSACLMVSGYFIRKRELDIEYNSVINEIRDNIGNGDYDIDSLLDEAQSILPKRIDAYEAKVESLYKSGNYNECISYGTDAIDSPKYDVITKDDKDSLGNMFYIVGNAYYENEDYSSAIANFQKAIEYNATNPLFYRDISISEAKNGNTEDAITYLNYAVDHGLEEDSIQMAKGEIEFSKSNYDLAIESFERAFELSADDSVKRRDMVLEINTYKKMGNESLDKAIEFMKNREGEFGDSSPYLIESMVDMYARKGDYQNAATYLAKLKNMGDISLRTYSNIAIVYQNMGDMSNAKKYLNEMIDTYPNEYESYMRYAMFEADEQSRLPNESRNYSDFAKYYNKAVELYQNAKADDVEMKKLSSMAEQLKSGGWFK